jgi:hypothetical protein
MKKLVLLCLVLTACSTTPSSDTEITQGEYEKVVRTQTRSADKYNGLYQTFQASVTLLSTDLLTAGLNRRSEFLGWDPAKFQKERDRTFQEAAVETKLFLRFYAPENDYNDLHKPNSIWKVYLDHNGKRYEGKVKKLTDKLVELQLLYPHFDRFSTPYEVSFAVPTAAVEATPAKVVLTSSLGAAEFEFGDK